MYPVSNAVKALFDAEQRQVLRITGTDRNGTAISITDANVMEGGFEIDRYSCNGEKLEIGTAIASELTLRLDNREGQFNGIVFEGAELFVEIGIADWEQTNPEITYIPCGYFTCYDQPRRLSTIQLNALDRMTFFDHDLTIAYEWSDGHGNVIQDGRGNTIYFNISLNFPCTIADLVSQICAARSVPFTQALTSFPNYNYVISTLPETNQPITMRNLIQWCAGAMGANAWIDWTGSLRFSFYGTTTGYVMTTANRFDSDFSENDITLTGVRYTNAQDVDILSGTDEYALDMSGNYLLATGAASILPNVYTSINGFTYRPFNATVIAAPYLWPMDRVTYTDADGNSFNCAVTNVNFGLNGATQISGRGETLQANGDMASYGVTKDQAYLVDKAVEATKTLDESLDQEAIFNRLTNNGEMQALLMYNGQLYLNASFIQTGELIADLIKGGTLKLGGYNNENGVLEILDKRGNVIGTWSSDGITATNVNMTGVVTSEGSQRYGSGTIGKTILSGGALDCYKNDEHAFAILGNNIYSYTGYSLNLHGNYPSTTVIRIGSTSDVEPTSDTIYMSADTIVLDARTTLRIGSFTGASGSFTTADGKRVTVTKGIITSII